jgi:hypothetical protein
VGPAKAGLILCHPRFSGIIAESFEKAVRIGSLFKRRAEGDPASQDAHCTKLQFFS